MFQKIKATLINEVYEGLYDGPHATPKPSEEGPIFLGIKNITTDGKLDLSTVRHISEGEFHKWTKRVTPKCGDIVFSYEATLNRYAIIPNNFKGCLGRRMALIRPNILKVNTKYLFYYFFSKKWRDQINRKKLSGATVDRIPLSQFPKYIIDIPELKIQQKIATILSNYDDLIENNIKRIELLEKIAKLIYDEWFVKFKFPGHKDVKMVNSELGKIPEGWGVKEIKEVVSFIKKGSSLKYTTPDKGIPVLNQKCVRNNKLVLQSIQYAEPIVNKELLLREFDLLVNSMGVGTLGRVGLNFNISKPMIIHNCVTLVRANESKLFQSLLYYNLLRKETELINLGTGSTGQTTLKPSSIESIKIIVPSTDLQSNANNIFIKIFNEIGLLQNKNKNLQQTRDLLLPKLINGVVDVSDLDIVVPEVEA